MRAATRRRRAAGLVVAALAVTAATGCAGERDSASPATSISTSANPSPSQEPSPEDQSMPESDTPSDRDAIIANFHARQQAMIDGDTEVLRQLSIPDSHAEHISGYNQPSGEWFDEIDSGYFDYHSIDNHTVDVTQTGPDTATLVARSTIDVTIGGSRNTWQLESTAEYLNVNGRWLSGDGRSQTYE